MRWLWIKAMNGGHFLRTNKNQKRQERNKRFGGWNEWTNLRVCEPERRYCPDSFWGRRRNEKRRMQPRRHCSMIRWLSLRPPFVSSSPAGRSVPGRPDAICARIHSPARCTPAINVVIHSLLARFDSIHCLFILSSHCIFLIVQSTYLFKFQDFRKLRSFSGLKIPRYENLKESFNILMIYVTKIADSWRCLEILSMFKPK